MTNGDKSYFSAGPRMSRRSLLRGAPLGAASLLAMRSVGPAWAQDQTSAAADHSIRCLLSRAPEGRRAVVSGLNGVRYDMVRARGYGAPVVSKY